MPEALGNAQPNLNPVERFGADGRICLKGFGLVC
jgi:hypothetical protein